MLAMARPRAPKRLQNGRSQDKLSSLSREVLKLRLQALSLPITGSKQQLISRLTAAIRNPAPRADRTASSRVRKASKRPRRASQPEREQITETSDVESTDELAVDESDDGASSIGGLVVDNMPTPTSLFTDDQLRVLQHTVELSVEQALRGTRGQASDSTVLQTPSVFPRPAGTATPLGLHRPLDQSLEDKILRGEYIDFSLLLPDSIAHPQAPSFQLRFDESLPGSLGSPLTMIRKRKPIIDSFHKWLDAYTTYMLTLVSHYPRRAIELLKYQQIISRAESKFRGLTWLSYDEQFHRRAAQDLSLNWGLVDLELWTVTFSGQAKPHCYFCSSPYHSQADCPVADPSRRTTRSTGTLCCFNFNKPSGCSRRSCQFPLVCSRCRSSSHSVLQCTSGLPKPGNNRTQVPSNRIQK